jgi:AraC-like DNA-binding protein
VKLQLPAPPLRTFIESIVYCKGHNLGHEFESALPDGTAQLQIVIGEGGREVVTHGVKQIQRLNKAWLMGINDVPVTYRLSEVAGVIYVRFKPAGLYAFTKIHQAELNNRVIDATIAFGSAIENLWETLAGSDQPAQMISHVENFFLKRINAIVVKPDMLSYMLDHVHLSLTQLEKKTGFSAKYLTKTFQKYVGVGPKAFQRIQRFHASISNLNQLTRGVDWADIVYQHGYHDQAHFIKEFRYFSGLSPQKYLSLGPSCTRYLHTSHLLEHRP